MTPPRRQRDDWRRRDSGAAFPKKKKNTQKQTICGMTEGASAILGEVKTAELH